MKFAPPCLGTVECCSARDSIHSALGDPKVIPHVRNLREFAELVEQAYGLASLPVPLFADISSIKEFCTGLLEPGTFHLWRGPISRLSLKDRLSVSGSLFLFRKTLPSAPVDPRAYVEKMGKDVSAPSPEYLAHCVKLTQEMFPLGWDRDFEKAVWNTTVTTGSTLESSRRLGGGRGLLTRGEFVSRSEFFNLVTKELPGPTNLGKSKVVVAKTDGKDRVVSINSVNMTMIQPVHQLIYSRLTKFPWLLRGEATPNSFRDFTRVKGEVFVSGDYESATDNLSLEVSKVILGVIMRNCRFIPLHVRESCMTTLGGVLVLNGREYPVRRGQLMGNALSFPLLCIHNYLAFKYSVPRSVPVKINGDDIVFRSTREEYNVWSKGVSEGGLTLSLGKTMVDSRRFSLNSTFFVGGDSSVSMAPVIRSTCLFKPLESIDALVGRFHSFRGFGGRRRDVMHLALLKKFRGRIIHSQRSISKGLGIRVRDDVIRHAGLFRRELFYLSLPEPPLQSTTLGYYQSCVPPGWHRVRVYDRSKTPESFTRELIALAWDPKIQDQGLTVDPRKGTYYCNVKRITMKNVRLLGLRTIPQAIRYLVPKLLPRSRCRGNLVWRRDSEGGDWRRNLASLGVFSPPSDFCQTREEFHL